MMRARVALFASAIRAASVPAYSQACAGRAWRHSHRRAARSSARARTACCSAIASPTVRGVEPGVGSGMAPLATFFSRKAHCRNATLSRLGSLAAMRSTVILSVKSGTGWSCTPQGSHPPRVAARASPAMIPAGARGSDRESPGKRSKPRGGLTSEPSIIEFDGMHL